MSPATFILTSPATAITTPTVQTTPNCTPIPAATDTPSVSGAIVTAASSSTAYLSGKFVNLTDDQLYRLCQQYGMNARLWMRKFTGLLPEVARRELYKKKGFHSIYEFAKKLAGMNEETVSKILNIANKLQDKPILKKLFESGKIGWGKIQTVAYIATPKTDGEWATKMKQLSLHSLQAYVQETRKLQTIQQAGGVAIDGDANNKNVIQEDVGRSFSTENIRTFSFPVTPAVEAKLRISKKKFEKEKGEVMSWNEVMWEMMKRLEQKEEIKMARSPRVKKTVQICPECVQKKADEAEMKRKVNRYIPAEVRKIIEERSDGKCEFPHCKRAYEILHHTRRFALRRNHDPKFIRALCVAHEGILQTGLVENEEDSPAKWRLRREPDRMSPKFQIDQKVQQFRSEPEIIREKIQLSSLPEVV